MKWLKWKWTWWRLVALAAIILNAVALLMKDRLDVVLIAVGAVLVWVPPYLFVKWHEHRYQSEDHPHEA